MTTGLTPAKIRRSMRGALIAALCFTTIPFLELSSARPRRAVIVVATIAALILWTTFLIQRRAYRALAERSDHVE
jgi:hypothetical protein